MSDNLRYRVERNYTMLIVMYAMVIVCLGAIVDITPTKPGWMATILWAAAIVFLLAAWARATDGVVRQLFNRVIGLETPPLDELEAGSE